MEEGGCTTLPQGKQLDALMVTIPKTLWKPRITLTEEICELAARGMTDNYDWESEHSVMADHTTQAEASPPQGWKNQYYLWIHPPRQVSKEQRPLQKAIQ